MLDLRQKLGEEDKMPQMLVCYLKVARQAQGTLFQRDFRTDIQEVINPEEKDVIRYGRLWRFSEPKTYNEYLYGKLGFIASGAETKPFYDETKHDFIQQTVDTQLTDYVLWVIDLSEQIMAFEIKPNMIKYQSFRGAFKGFLAKRPELGFEIEDFPQAAQFIAWASELDRVTLFKAKLRLPNPDWSKVPKSIQDFIRNTKADKGRIELGKDKDSTDSLEFKGTIIEDAVAYGEYGYSDIMARGEKGNKPIVFDSSKDSPSDQISIDKDITEDEKRNTIIDMLDKFIVGKFKNEN